MRSLDESSFRSAIESLIRDSDARRLDRMSSHRSRNFLALTLTITAVIGGAGAFGWFFLMDGDLATGLACLLAALALPVLAFPWAEAPVKRYRAEHKTKFMPALAGIFGLKYYPARGISRETLKKTGIVPAHRLYHAEDCMAGRYKGVRIIFSEARLTHPQHNGEYVFHGVFVLLELPGKPFAGHSVVTADNTLARRLAAKLKPVALPADMPPSDFIMLSSRPENAGHLQHEGLLREFSEMSQIFDNAPISAAFFGGNSLFMMIPNNADMFEPCNINLPIATFDTALTARQEIGKILAIVDILELYGPAPALADGSDDAESPD